MKYVITNNENIITAISNKCERNEEYRNLILDDYNIAYGPDEVLNIYQVEVPEYVEVEKYCYTEMNGFYNNANYTEPPKPVEERVDTLETSTTEIELALADIYEEMINNG